MENSIFTPPSIIFHFLEFSRSFLEFHLFSRKPLMDLTHFNALLPVIFRKRVTLISCVLFYNLLRLVSSTIISGGITSHVSLARSLNSFVLPVHEVDVSLAPILGRQCALLEKIPADYRLSFSRCNLNVSKTAFYL